MSMLSAMSFTLLLDREADESIMNLICPGGYILNDKAFDFCNVGYTPMPGNKLLCEATGFDMEFFRDAAEDNGRRYTTLSETDVTKGVFSEFFVYNGEHTEENGACNVLGVEDLKFEFENGRAFYTSNYSKITRSANDSLSVNQRIPEKVEENEEK